MNISNTDRLILWNQYEILKALYPKNADMFEEKQQILANGYEVFYAEIRNHLTLDPMTKAASNFVMEVLDMYRALEAFYSASGKPAGSSFDHFSGFDGNNENAEHAFANFLFDVQGKWVESSKHPRNSHTPMISTYAKMVDEWKRSNRQFELTAGDVQRICR
jgi:uncharacterized protein YfbU (UPF0304 family)